LTSEVRVVTEFTQGYPNERSQNKVLCLLLIEVMGLDFGEILDKWEKNNAIANPSGDWLKDIPVFDKDSFDRGNENRPGERRQRLLRKKPDACIDLHGLSGEEAWIALESFFENSRRQGHEKLLIIHGKGNHYSAVSDAPIHANAGVLKNTTKRFIENCPFAGENGFAHIREGGSGATWVILKKGEKTNAHGR